MEMKIEKAEKQEEEEFDRDEGSLKMQHRTHHETHINQVTCQSDTSDFVEIVLFSG